MFCLCRLSKFTKRQLFTGLAVCSLKFPFRVGLSVSKCTKAAHISIPAYAIESNLLVRVFSQSALPGVRQACHQSFALPDESVEFTALVRNGGSGCSRLEGPRGCVGRRVRFGRRRRQGRPRGRGGGDESGGAPRARRERDASGDARGSTGASDGYLGPPRARALPRAAWPLGIGICVRPRPRSIHDPGQSCAARRVLLV